MENAKYENKNKTKKKSHNAIIRINSNKFIIFIYKQDDGGATEAAALTLDNVGGVFFVLAVGIFSSVFYTVWEMLWEIGWTSYKEHTSFKEKLIEELRFVIKCKGTVRPVIKRNSSAHSTDDSTGGDTPPYGFVPTVITTTHQEDQP